MMTFIRINSGYLCFWLVMGLLFLIGGYWAVRLGVIDAIRISQR